MSRISEMMKELKTEVLSFDGHPARELDLEQKDLYLKGLSIIITVDNETHPKEVEYLKVLVKSFGIDDDLVDELLSFGKNPPKDAMYEIIRFLQNNPLAKVFLADALMLIHADGKIKKSEVDLLKDYGEMFKLTTKEIDEIVYFVGKLNEREERALYCLLHRKTTSLNDQSFGYLLRYYDFDPSCLKLGVWEELPGDNRFSPRCGHDVAVHNNALWLIGGCDGSYMNDIWMSEDGKNWNEMSSEVPFSGRSGHRVVEFDNALHLIGGENSDGKCNDVWRME